jgi:hypothetical protein
MEVAGQSNRQILHSTSSWAGSVWPAREGGETKKGRRTRRGKRESKKRKNKGDTIKERERDMRKYKNAKNALATCWCTLLYRLSTSKDIWLLE